MWLRLRTNPQRVFFFSFFRNESVFALLLLRVSAPEPILCEGLAVGSCTCALTPPPARIGVRTMGPF